MTNKAKFMLISIPLLLILIISKSLFFDEVKVTGDALEFKHFVEKEAETNEKYNRIFEKIGIAEYKVVSIKKTKDTGTSIIPSENGDIEIPGAYKARVRGYLFNLFPYKEFNIRSNWQNKEEKK